MALKRIIPCLLYDGAGLVKTIKFKNPSYVGDPINAIKIFNEKEVDELILIDIMASKQKRRPNFGKIADMAGEAFMPFAYGGGVKTFEDFAILYKSGVEKVVVNSLIQENPAVVKNAVDVYGSQAVVACVDYKKYLLKGKVPASYLGHKIGRSLQEYVSYLETEIGVGEIMLQSMDLDGTWAGFDLEVNKLISSETSLPLIAAGGCGSTADIKQVLYECGLNAAAIGSMAVYSKKGMGVLINFPGRKEIILE